MHNSHNQSAFKLARLVWARRKWLAVFAFAVPFSAAVSLIVAMPDLYRAHATVLVKQERMPESVTQSVAGIELESRLQLINQEILSRSRLQELIEHFDLYPELRQRAAPEVVIKRIRNDIHYQPKEIVQPWGQKATVAFSLSYQSWDPNTAAEVTNTLASLYIEENEKLRRRQEAGTQVFDTVDQLEELERQLAALRTRFSERYPDVIQLKAKIAALEKDRALMGQDSPSAAGPSKLAERKDGEQFRILEPAIPPNVPVAPSRIRLLLMALILSLGVGGVAALLAEQLDTSFHQLDELWAYTNLPVLASVPHIVVRGDAWRSTLRFGFTGVVAVFALALVVRGSLWLGEGSEQLVWLLAQRAS
jgi:uncharacterized protein involved in exopolysaccharide biosynthesis